MIRFRTGLPRNGKTLSLVHDLILELVFTERFIVTNLTELKLPELTAYLNEHYPERCVDLDDRLRILPKVATSQFYRYRSGGLVLPEISVDRHESREEFLARFIEYFAPVGDPKHPEWGKAVTYMLTEAHDYFDSREWADIARPVLMYVSKHAHLHDEILLETQHPDMLAVQFKRLVAYTEEMQNQYKMTFGPFRRPGCFRKTVYYRIPSGSSAVPVEVTTFKLDLAIANCYDTTGALGILGRGPESESVKKKKLPWWTLWAFGGAFAVVVAVLCWYLPALLTGALTHMVGQSRKGVEKAFFGQPAAPAASSKAPVSGIPDTKKGDEARVHVNDVPRWGNSPVNLLSQPVWVRGYVVSGSRIQVVLSDGRVLTEGDASLARVDRRSVVVDGQTLYFAPDVPSVSSYAMPQVVRSEVVQPSKVEPEAVKTMVPQSVDEGSWRLDPDGVRRLKVVDTLGAISTRR